MAHRACSNPDYLSYIDDYLAKKRVERNDANRCAALMDPRIATSVGWCYENLKQAWQGKNRKNLLLIERADLVAEPEATLARIYEFLDITGFRTTASNASFPIP